LKDENTTTKKTYDPSDFDFELGDALDPKDSKLLSTLIISKKEYQSKCFK
jgi:hypothetical protein